MYRAIAILLMISLGFQSLVKLGIVTWYQVNKDYVAKNLCENRDKPQLKCCGKCYLRKQLNKANGSNETNRTLPNKTEKTETVDFIVAQKIMLARVFYPDAHTYNPSVTTFCETQFVTSIFHPPSIVC